MLTKKDLNDIGNLMDTKLKKELMPIKKDLKKIDKKLDFTINHFDKSQTIIVKNVREIQEHDNLPVMDYV